MMSAKALLAATFLALPAPLVAEALTLEFPSSARQTAERVETFGSYRVPISDFENGEIQSLWAEGQVRQQAWQVPGQGRTTLQLLAPLKRQILAAGFEVIFECEARECGGFDFRYATEVLPEPDMHVDLGDYRFVAAHRMGEERPEYVSLLVSRSAGRGFVQITRVGPQDAARDVLVASTKNPGGAERDEMFAPGNQEDQGGSTTAPMVDAGPGAEAGSLTRQLESQGRAVLSDLEFDTGSSQLGSRENPSLDELAAYLKANPERSIVLVGHTDAEGTLAGNIALSRKRATSVRSELIRALGVPASQVRAEGVGFLAPLTTNLTEQGREANRRVEVILSSTE